MHSMKEKEPLLPGYVCNDTSAEGVVAIRVEGAIEENMRLSYRQAAWRIFTLRLVAAPILLFLALHFLEFSSDDETSFDWTSRPNRVLHGFKYPVAKTVNASDDVHGVTVKDPYRWFENPFDEEVVNYMNAQDTLAKTVVQGLPGYKKFLLEFYRANAFDRFSSPLKKGDYWYYTANFGGHLNQNILYRTKDLDNKFPEIFLNPNELSPKGVDQVDGWTFSPDNSLFAFVSTKNETDYGYIGFRNVSNGQPFDIYLRYTARYIGNLAFEWHPDGVTYMHFENPNLEWTTAGRNNDPFPMNMRRSFHRFGTPQSEDIDCGSIDIDPTKPAPPLPPVCTRKSSTLTDSRSQTYTSDRIVSIAGNTGARSASLETIRLRRAAAASHTFYQHPVSLAAEIGGASMSSALSNEEMEMLIMGVTPVRWIEEGIFVGQIEAGGDAAGFGKRVMSIYKTAFGASRFRLLGVYEEEDGEVNAIEVLPEHEKYTLDEVYVIDKEKGYVLVTYIADVTNIIRIYTNFTSENGGDLYEELPLTGGVCSNVVTSVISGANSTSQGIVSFKYDFLLDPGTVYIYNPAVKGKFEVFRKMELSLGSRGDGFKVEQFFFKSRDGTVDVPIWTARGPAVRRKTGHFPHKSAGIAEGDGESMLAKPWTPAKVFVTGYGRPDAMYALVNARGGKEYGMEWYEGGRNLKKQNVFDDFVGASRFLVGQGWTEPGRLGIQGASNGGLMAAAVSLQAPELFGAAVVDVGVHDINRFERFTFGRAWSNDYGRAENATESIARLAWSPVQTAQNLSPGGFHFTPTLISTGDHDTRVSPLHSLKLAAAMQRVAAPPKADGGVGTPESVVLLRIRELSGHNIFSLERQAKAWAEKIAFWGHMVGAEGLV
ncbi:prolyl oligopeptidase family-domain-containing protein [Chytridium lagenaria]|nr:prolyl oligopeptidase family-domain-containing protein [Chytridium lagenaria]